MKASTAKGTRDFLPAQARRRKYIFEVIENTFKNYAYQPLETPAMENLDTLMGKYGDEGDKLLFKIINSGDFLKEVKDDELQSKDSNKILRSISEKGLRYDLTVPFARVVAMNQHNISLPFKRYQIQPVWRADRPQRGRYREFYQCDADVVGSSALYYEAELMQIYDRVFHELGIPVKILINHRAILEGIAEQAMCADRFMSMTMILDKLDKIGEEKVKEELINIDITEEHANWILNQIQKKDLGDFRFNEKAIQGSTAIEKVKNLFDKAVKYNTLEFDCSLARGLSYYTGCIFEVVPTSIKMGSLGGGGRYDNLTGVFGLHGVSGVGISFGADRIYDVMEELNLWPESLVSPMKAIIMCLDESSLDYGFNLMSELRQEGISIDMYPEAAKLKKQFKYAEDLKIEYAIFIGETERNTGIVNIKNLKSGDQQSVKRDELRKFFE